MKLTAGVILANILRTAFSPISFTNTNCKHRQSCSMQYTCVHKGCIKNIDEIGTNPFVHRINGPNMVFGVKSVIQLRQQNYLSTLKWDLS